MALQAIITRCFGPTTYRGLRIKATASAGSATISWDCAKSADANHKAAAEALALKFGWRGRWVEGGMPGGTGNVYVCDVGDTRDVFVVEG